MCPHLIPQWWQQWLGKCRQDEWKEGESEHIFILFLRFSLSLGMCSILDLLCDGRHFVKRERESEGNCSHLFYAAAIRVCGAVFVRTFVCSHRNFYLAKNDQRTTDLPRTRADQKFFLSASLIFCLFFIILPKKKLRTDDAYEIRRRIFLYWALCKR